MIYTWHDEFSHQDLFIKTAQMLPSEIESSRRGCLHAKWKRRECRLHLEDSGLITATGFKAGLLANLSRKSTERQTQFVTVDGITRINVFTQVVATNEEFKPNQRSKCNTQSKLLF